MTLSADNSGYAGSLTVGGGTLLLGNAAGLGAGVVTVLAGGTLDFASLAATNRIALNGGTLANYGSWTGDLVVNYAGATGSGVTAALATYGRTSVTVLTGGSLDVSGLSSDVVLSGGSLAGDLSSYTGNLTVRSALSLASGTTSGKVTLDGGTIDLGNRQAASGESLYYRSGSLLGAGNFRGDLLVDIAGANLAAGTLGATRVVVNAGKSVNVGVGFSNDIRLAGGEFVADSLTNYQGTVTVAGGATLDLDGAADYPALVTAANVVVERNARLKGNATVGAVTVQSGGILAPGNSPGKITAASLSLAGGGTFEFEVSGVVDLFGNPVAIAGVDPAAVAGLYYDTIAVTGQLSLSQLLTGPKFQLNLRSLFDGAVGAVNGWDPGVDWQFTLFSYGSLDLAPNTYLNRLFAINSDNFLNLDGTPVDASHFSVVNDSLNNQVLLVYSTIPEPSTYGLMLGGLALAATAYRRRRAKGQAQS